MKNKFSIAMSLAMLAAMLVTSLALADYLVNNIDNTIDGTLETRTITTGGSTTVGFYVQPNNSDPNDVNGCNATGSIPVTVTLNVPGAVTASSTSLTFTDCGKDNDLENVSFSSNTVGSYNIGVASVSGGKTGSAWTLGEASFTLVVNAPAVQNQTITFGALVSKTYGDPDFSVSATASSGLSVSFTASDDCTVSGNTVHITGAGSCIITAKQAGNASYNAAPDVSQSFSIAQADALVAVSGYSDVYDAAAHGASGTATGIGGVDLSSGLNLGATYTDVPGGTANWTFEGGANYLDESGSVQIVISQADATVNVVGYTGNYDGAAHGASGTATGVGGADLSTGLNFGATYTDVPGGNAHWTFEGGTNYLDESGNVTITINKAPVTATAGSGSSIYDGATHSPSACEVTGAYTGDLSCTNNPASVGPIAGTTTIAPVVTGTGLSNFEINSVDGSYTIEKADASIVVTPYDVTYNGSAHTATGTVTGVNSEDLSADLDLSGTVHTDAGTYSDTWTFTDSTGNYNNDSGTITDKIAQAPVTATAGSGSSTYDNATHSPSACAVTGAYTGDLSCANNPASVGPNAGTTVIAPVVSGTGLSNFAVTSVNGSYTINKADAICTVTGYSVVYDGNPHTATGSCTGIGGSLDVLGGLDLSSTTHTLVGTYLNDLWSFTDSTGNYNDTNGTVNDYILAWTLKGFYQPVDMFGVLNTVKGGSTVPLKFEVFAGSTELTNTAIVSTLLKQVTCNATAEDTVEVLATGGTSLRYDTVGGQFIYNWQTPKLPGKCYSVTLTTQDGSSITALFKLK